MKHIYYEEVIARGKPRVECTIKYNGAGESPPLLGRIGNVPCSPASSPSLGVPVSCVRNRCPLARNAIASAPPTQRRIR